MIHDSSDLEWKRSDGSSNMLIAVTDASVSGTGSFDSYLLCTNHVKV